MAEVWAAGVQPQGAPVSSGEARRPGGAVRPRLRGGRQDREDQGREGTCRACSGSALQAPPQAPSAAITVLRQAHALPMLCRPVTISIYSNAANAFITGLRPNLLHSLALQGMILRMNGARSSGA